MTHSWGPGLATIQCHFSGFLNKMESALRSCLSELTGRSPLRSQAAQGFLPGSQEGIYCSIYGQAHQGRVSSDCAPRGTLSSQGLLKGEAAA